MQNLLGLSYVCMALTIGKKSSFPILSSNGTTLNLILSTIDSINTSLLTYMVIVSESIMRQVPICISSGLRIGLIVMLCVPIFRPHTNLTVLNTLIWMQCHLF